MFARLHFMFVEKHFFPATKMPHFKAEWKSQQKFLCLINMEVDGLFTSASKTVTKSSYI